jgi:hypothetical protein
MVGAAVSVAVVMVIVGLAQPGHHGCGADAEQGEHEEQDQDGGAEKPPGRHGIVEGPRAQGREGDLVHCQAGEDSAQKGREGKAAWRHAPGDLCQGEKRGSAEYRADDQKRECRTG